MTRVALPLCWFENIAKLRIAYKMEGLLLVPCPVETGESYLETEATICG